MLTLCPATEIALKRGPKNHFSIVLHHQVMYPMNRIDGNPTQDAEGINGLIYNMQFSCFAD
jgi:hypothetical protein